MVSISTKRSALLIAWFIALLCMVITLYSSEIANLPVCHLCWYQRIALYPLTILLGIAAFRDDLNIAIYAIPLAFIGALFALYQYLQQMIPNFSPIEFCSMGQSCSTIHLKLLGFITFPLLSLIAALLMIILLLIAKKQ